MIGGKNRREQVSYGEPTNLRVLVDGIKSGERTTIYSASFSPSGGLWGLERRIDTESTSEENIDYKGNYSQDDILGAISRIGEKQSHTKNFDEVRVNLELVYKRG